MEVCGFQENHTDLKNNVNSTLGNDGQTDLDHGTGVCGIIAAEYNNKKGISGITMNKGKIDYFSYKGYKGSYTGVNNSKYADMMTFRIGLSYLCSLAKKNNQTAIINVSLGFSELIAYASYGSKEARTELNTYNDELEKFLERLLEKEYEFLIVKAAGNTNEEQFLKVEYDENDIENTKYGYVPYKTDKDSDEYKKYSYLYPTDDNELMTRLAQGNCDAQYDIFSGINSSKIKNRIIVVGAVENKGNNQFKLSEWFSVCGSRVDILAPGKGIETLASDNSIQYGENFYGTSFSTPYVTGVAGLILSMEPTIPGDTLKEILVQSGKGEYKTYITRYDDRSKDECNYPMIDALDAVKLAENGYEKNNATSVKFTLNSIEEDNGVLESAVIDGLDDQNQVVWTYETEAYGCVDYDRVSEIGMKNDIYYFVEDHAIIALNVSDGSILWTNEEFWGSPETYIFDENGNLYICCLYGPDLFIVNEKGKTLYSIYRFDENEFMTPTQIKYDNDKLYITFNKNYSYLAETTCIVDLKDYII